MEEGWDEGVDEPVDGGTVRWARSEPALMMEWEGEGQEV